MTAGLTIFNNNNVIQIDGRHNNLQFIYKKTFIYDPPTGFISGSISIPCQDGEVIAFSTPYCPFKIIDYSRSSPDIVKYWIIGERLETYSYYVFRHSQIPEGRHFEVRNESGQIVYSDNARFMDVAGLFSGSYVPSQRPGVVRLHTIKKEGPIGNSWEQTAVVVSRPNLHFSYSFDHHLGTASIDYSQINSPTWALYYNALVIDVGDL